MEVLLKRKLQCLGLNRSVKIVIQKHHRSVWKRGAAKYSSMYPRIWWFCSYFPHSKCHFRIWTNPWAWGKNCTQHASSMKTWRRRCNERARTAGRKTIKPAGGCEFLSHLVAKFFGCSMMFHTVPDLWGIAHIHAPNQGKSAESCRNWSSNKEPPISRWKDWDVALRCESPKFPCLIITGSPLRKPFWNKFHFERISRENHIDVIWQYMTTI